MANYEYKIVQSLDDLNNVNQPEMRFHFRGRIKDDSDKNTPPYLEFLDGSNKGSINSSTTGNDTHHIVTVQLKETNTKVGPLNWDYVFESDNNPVPYDNITAEIRANIIPLDAANDPPRTDSTGNDDLVFPTMDADHP